MIHKMSKLNEPKIVSNVITGEKYDNKTGRPIDPNKKICLSCQKIKEDLLDVQIGLFYGILCQNCYVMKMLEEICEILDIKNYSFWVKQK